MAVVAGHAVVGGILLGDVALLVVPHRRTVGRVDAGPAHEEHRADVVALDIGIGAEVLLNAVIELQQDVGVVGQVQFGGPAETVFLLADNVLGGQRQVEAPVAQLTDVAVDLGVAGGAADVEVAQQVLSMVVVPVEVDVEAVEQLQTETEVGLVGSLPAQRVVGGAALRTAVIAVIGVALAIGIEAEGFLGTEAGVAVGAVAGLQLQDGNPGYLEELLVMHVPRHADGGEVGPAHVAAKL